MMLLEKQQVSRRKELEEWMQELEANLLRTLFSWDTLMTPVNHLHDSRDHRNSDKMKSSN